MPLVAVLNRKTDAATVLWFEVPVSQWPMLRPAVESKTHHSSCLLSFVSSEMLYYFAQRAAATPLHSNDLWVEMTVENAQY